MRSRRRDEFDQFFLENYESVVRSVTFVCGNAERAADATQQAFIRAFDRWTKVHRYDNPGAWVRRIAINLTRDERRSEERRLARERVTASAAVLPDPTLVVGWQSSPVLASLMALPERQRAIASLFYIDDLSVAEIATTLDIAEGTVRFHLSQARDRMRSVLEETDHVV